MKLEITAHIHIHPAGQDEIKAALIQIKTGVNYLISKGTTMADKIQEVLNAANAALAKTTETAAAVALIPPAIDTLEAAITALKASLGTLTPEQTANLDAALVALNGVVDTAALTAATAGSAAADAADGIDEAAPTP